MFGGKQLDAAVTLKGVKKVVQVGDNAVAVVPIPWRAKNAADALPIVWDNG